MIPHGQKKSPSQTPALAHTHTLSMLRLGSAVRYADERGVVVCLDPLVMCTADFHSYVALRERDMLRVLDEPCREHVTPLPEAVRERIVRYFENGVATGEGEPAPGTEPTGGSPHVS